jgi:hypothetical protein
MMPFDSYPDGGKKLLGCVGGRGGECRRGYGLKFMQKTGQTACAYCGLDFVVSYENWLQMALDHVVPTSICKRFALPREWVDDYTNKVLACKACNEFENRYELPTTTECPRSLDAFYGLRERIFTERKARIAHRHKIDREFFKLRLWEKRL